jgi:uncharacterized protein
MLDQPTITARQREILGEVLRPFADVIDSVGVFGSRAIGTARENSDIDLVIYGPITERQIDRLWTLFDESNLAVRVDILGYNHIKNAAMRAHIDRFMRPLFGRNELTG